MLNLKLPSLGPGNNQGKVKKGMVYLKLTVTLVKKCKLNVAASEGDREVCPEPATRRARAGYAPAT